VKEKSMSGENSISIRQRSDEMFDVVIKRTDACRRDLGGDERGARNPDRR
jgi:hypothetical protein